MNVINKKYNQLINLVNKVNLIYHEIMNRTKDRERELHSYKSPKINLGNIQSTLNNQKASISSLAEVEFQVFSQFGDDGIIQWLINHLDIPKKTFVEFGVEKYIESNTRFLLFNNNWDGLVIDGDEKNIKYIREDFVTVFFNVKSTHSFITKDNINELIKASSLHTDLGLLSIDIDGNDYWIWNAVNVCNPVIVICEYNAEYGLNPWTMPYKEDFVWDKVNDMYYWGTSLQSICDLAETKGYSFIGCNSQGNNAYFIRNDKLGTLKKMTCEEGYVKAGFSLKRKKDGSHFTDSERQEELVGKQIYNTRTQKIEIISER